MVMDHAYVSMQATLLFPPSPGAHITFRQANEINSYVEGTCEIWALASDSIADSSYGSVMFRVIESACDL
jgi:hypothetical protein